MTIDLFFSVNRSLHCGLTEGNMTKCMFGLLNKKVPNMVPKTAVSEYQNQH